MICAGLCAGSAVIIALAVVGIGPAERLTEIAAAAFTTNIGAYLWVQISRHLTEKKEYDPALSEREKFILHTAPAMLYGLSILAIFALTWLPHLAPIAAGSVMAASLTAAASATYEAGQQEKH